MPHSERKNQKVKEPEEREIELQRPGVLSGPFLPEIDIKLQRPNFNSQFQEQERGEHFFLFEQFTLCRPSDFSST
jgi:hypothetical protein